jgi:virulence factor Mce-like protein
MKRTAAIVVALAVVAGIGWWLMKPAGGTRIEARFSSTVGLYPGSSVQVLGVPVGHVTKVTPEGADVRVEMRLDPGEKVSGSTAAVIVAPTLVSDRFVQLTVPYTRGATAMADGAVIPIERTAVPVEIDQLYKGITSISEALGPKGANRKGALSRMLKVAAANLGGNGSDLNQMIREFGKATATLSGTGDDFFATIANLGSFNQMLEDNDAQVGSVNKRFAAVSSYLAADREDMASAVTELGKALAVVQGFIKDNRGHLNSSVRKLIGPTRVLTRQKKSLSEAVQLIPLALQNFLKAYDPSSNTVAGRGNLNELTLWSGSGLSARTSKSSPPTLLPGVDDKVGAAR